MVKQDEKPPQDPASRYLVAKAAGELIAREGETGSEMFIVEDGEVEIFKERAGREKVLSRLGPGDFFGEMAVLEGRPRSASLRAATACRLLPIDASTLDALLREYPEIAVRMLRKLSHRVRRYEEEEEAAFEAARAALGQAPQAAAAAAASAEDTGTAVARLEHPESGRSFPVVAGKDSIVGRFDPVTETSPEVDLGEIDTQRTTSRRHARVRFRGGKFFVVEEVGTANGTWLGQERLPNGVERELADGDRLRFGLVDLVFRLGAGG